MKRQNGITLIALVITIIVLLILAGVSISMALGQNGILTRAEGAVDTYKEAERNELAELQNVAEYMDQYGTTPGISASGIAPKDYGKQVTGYTLDNYSGTWEILYADDSNIYLITTNTVSDPIYNSRFWNVAVEAGTYAAGSSLLTTNPTHYPAASKWFRTWLDSGFTSTEMNMQGTLFMLDSTNVWNGTYRNETFADWAIGSPTYELLAESVNDVLGTAISPTPGKSGYDNHEWNCTLTDDSVWNRNEVYWLASPHMIEEAMCAFIHEIGEIRDCNCGHGSNSDVGAYRPVVCLNSSVRLEEGTDGTTYAIKK